MSRERVENQKYQCIGYIEKRGSRQVATDANGSQLGEYDPQRDETTPRNGRRSKGDLLRVLIFQADADKQRKLEEVKRAREHKIALDKQKREEALRLQEEKAKRSREEALRLQEQKAKQKREEARRQDERAASDRREAGIRQDVRKAEEGERLERRKRIETERQAAELQERADRLPRASQNDSVASSAVAHRKRRRKLAEDESEHAPDETSHLYAEVSSSGSRWPASIFVLLLVAVAAGWMLHSASTRQSNSNSTPRVETAQPEATGTARSESNEPENSAEVLPLARSAAADSVAPPSAAPDAQTSTEMTGSTFLVLHRHGRGPSPGQISAVALDSEVEPPEGFCIGQLTIGPDAVRFVTTKSADKRRDDLTAPLSRIEKTEVKGTSHLHVATKGLGDWDFFAGEGTIAGALSTIIQRRPAT